MPWPSQTPHGPWRKLDEPILSAADNSEWLGDEDDRFAVLSKGDFDSHKVHDPCLIHYADRFWLYYKGEQMGEGFTFGGREIRWGAVADHPEGPYVKSAWHPVTKRPRGVCVDLSRRCRFVDDGRPEKNTFQYAPDGVNFEIVAVLKGAPEALGPFRPAKPSDTDPLDGIRWGLCHVDHEGWQYIRRFDAVLPHHR